MKKSFAKSLIGLFCLSTLLATASPLKADAAVVASQALAKGVDVSKYQGAVNWAAVAGQGYSFMFAKIGSSKGGIDPTFAANMYGAAAAGMRTGAYVYSYATTVESAVAEATMAIAALQNMPVSMPVAFDIEDNVQKGLNPVQQQAIVNAFCTTVEAEGYVPMVYASKNWFLTRLGPTMFDQWVAQYADTCDYPLAFTCWQQTSNGTVTGINGRVDINYLYKDYGTEIISDGWINRKGFFYFFQNWHMVRGWIDYGGFKWYTDAQGHMITGWQDIEGNGKMRYFYVTGPMAVGITKVGANTYFFGADGVMLTGWQDVNGMKFLLGPDGVMQFGWYIAPEGVYYFAENGVMCTGIQVIDGHIYYFDAKGHMQTGWQTIGGLRFYFNEKGIMQTGWFADPTGMYYLGPNGAALLGWQDVEGKRVHFDEVTGKLSVNELITVGTSIFYVGADGSLQTGWQQIAGGICYFDPTGAMVVNTVMEIDGINYLFDQNGFATPIAAPALPLPDAGAASQ